MENRLYPGHRIKIHTERPLTLEALKFLSSRISHYACWPPFLLPSVARQHTILDTRWFLQSPLDPVFRASYVLSRSRSCVCLSVCLSACKDVCRNPGGIIKLQERLLNEGSGQNMKIIQAFKYGLCTDARDQKYSETFR